MSRSWFHLAIPAGDLEATRRWYVEGLGCGIGRGSEHAQILELGGHQLVAQKVAAADLTPQQRGIYPRHFGLVFERMEDWQALLARARAAALRFGVEPKCRFAGGPLEHYTFFLIDPSGNWLEFKCYRHPEAMLGCSEQTVVGDADYR